MATRLGLLDLIFYPIFKALGKKMPKCEHCKTTMEKKDNPKLFLIPVMFGHEYKATKEYYVNNCRPINSVQEIPTGQRACRFWQLVCPQCGQRMILIEDFLRVRDTETIEQRALFLSEDLAGLV